MVPVGGNITATFLKRSVVTNELGEQMESWDEVAIHKGWLDMTAGTSDYQYARKLENSTHMFVCDRFDLPECGRLRCAGKVFDIVYVDDPMELGCQLEIYLTYVGKA